MNRIILRHDTGFSRQSSYINKVFVTKNKFLFPIVCSLCSGWTWTVVGYTATIFKPVLFISGNCTSCGLCLGDLQAVATEMYTWFYNDENLWKQYAKPLPIDHYYRTFFVGQQ